MNNHQNLRVPFEIPIPGGVSAGKVIKLQGFIPPMSKRFAVNLLSNTGDIALSVGPKFYENKIVMNNVSHMMWGQEESGASMPISPGENFDLVILCEPFDFKIAFNNQHFADFKHRLPFSSITELSVEGEVDIQNVDFKDQNANASNKSASSSNSSYPAYGFAGPQLSNNNSDGLYPSAPSNPNPPKSLYPSNITFPHSGGTDSPKNASLYPSQPVYGNDPNKVSYPKVPSPQPGTYPQVPSDPYQGSYPQTPTNPYQGPSPHQGPYPQVPPNPYQGSYPQGPGNPYQGSYPQGPGNPYQGGNPSQGPYPQPNQHSDGHRSSKPNFLNQAGMAIAGALGTALLTNMLHKKTNTQGQGRPSFLDQAGRTLAGVFGGGGAGFGRSQRGMQPNTPTHSNSNVLDQAGSALAGIFGGSGGGLLGSGGRRGFNFR